MLKIIKYIFLFFITYISFGQANKEYNFNIKKYHQNIINDVIINDDLNEIISADSEGNILIHNSVNYNFIRSLNTVNTKTVLNIRLINSNKDLLINYYNKYTKKGELCFYNLKNNTIYKIITGNLKITNPNGESLIAIAKDDSNLILYSKSPFKKIDSITTNKPVLNSTTSFDKKYIATLEEVNKNPGPKSINGSLEIKTLTFYDIELKKNVHNIKFSDKSKIPSAILFEKENLFLLTSDQQRNSSELNRINLIDFKVEKLSNNDFYTSSADTKIISNSRNNILIINNVGLNSYGARSCMDLNLQNGLYFSKSIKMNFRTSIGVFNKVKNEYVFFAGKTFSNVNANINVLDLKYNVLEKNLFVKDYIKSKSLFISNDNWISFRTLSGYDKFFHLYKNGELSNSFLKNDQQSNSFFKTSELNFKLHYDGFNESLIDKDKSIIGYSNFDKTNKGNFYYSYNLLDNKKLKICKRNKGDNALTFNAEENAFIIEYDKKKNNYNSKTKLKIVNKHRAIVVDTSFTTDDKIKFSNSGKYICLVKRNSIKILDWKNNKQLLKHDFVSSYIKRVFQISENNFIVSGYNYETETDKKTYFYFTISEDKGNFKITEQEGTLVLSADFKNKQLAILTTNGILINGKNHKIDSQNGHASSISLNADASKMLVNFSSGITRLLETKTFNWLNTIIHFPDNKSLIFNTKGRYYSNFEDVNDYLFLTKNNKRFSLEEYGSKLYNPISILSDFGDVKDEMKSKINEALKIRLQIKKELRDKKEHIKNFYLAKNKTSLETKQLKNKIHIELAEDFSYDFVIKINNVTQNNLNFKKINPKIYETEINISQKINKIAISSLYKNEYSAPLTKEITYEYVIPRNLYLLSIGVSDYKNKDFKLNYAHKDALDLSLRYGAINDKRITSYLNKVYPISIKKIKNNKTETVLGNINSVINFFENGYPATFQLSKNGNYWVETILEANNSSDKVKALNLYDFKRNTISNIPIEKDVFLDFEKPNFKSHANNLGFYYSSRYFNENEESIYDVYFYDFKTKETSKTNIPINIDLAYPINEYDWLTTNNPNYYDYELQNEEIEKETHLSVTQHIKVNNIWSKKKYDTNIKLEDFDSVINVSDDGSLVLIRHYTDEQIKYSLFKLINGNYTQTILGFDDFIEDIFISKDNSKIVAFNTFDGLLNLLTYSIRNKKIKKEQTKIDSFEELQLIGNNYGEPFVIKPSSVDVYSDYYERHADVNQFLSTLKAKPFSYKNTFVKTLTNEEASSKNILKVANSFFKNSKAEDQVILFLAGHGILNRQLNYYYAPQDMVFNNPEEKGISYSTIVDVLSNAPAIQKLLITDTCHSGNTFDINKYDVEEEKLKSGQRGTIAKSISKNKITTSSIISSVFDNFFSKNGITVLSASSGQEVAYEFNNIYNGAFTSSYLKVLETHINKQTVKDFDFTYSYNKNKHFNIILSNLEKRLLSITKNKQKMDIREINNLAKTILW